MKKLSKISLVTTVFAIAVGLFANIGFANAAAPTQSTCDFADPTSIGKYVDTLCLTDFANLDVAAVQSLAGQDFSVSLPNGVTLTFNIKQTAISTPDGVSLNLSATTVPAPISPTYNPFGNTGYTGMTGDVNFYLVTSPGGNATTSVVTYEISNIKLTSSAGQLNGYSFVVADTEVTTGGEFWNVSSDQSIDLLDTLPSTDGNTTTACNLTPDYGLGTNNIVCQNTSGSNYRAAGIFSSDNATDISVSLSTHQRQGFGFGVNIGTLYVVHNVSFNANGGSGVNSQTIANGGVATKPADPTRNGYTFSGWFANSDLTTPADFTQPINADITFFAKWTPVTNSGNIVPSPPSTGVIATGSVAAVVIIGGLTTLLFARLTKQRKSERK